MPSPGVIGRNKLECVELRASVLMDSLDMDSPGGCGVEMKPEVLYIFGCKEANSANMNLSGLFPTS